MLVWCNFHRKINDTASKYCVKCSGIARKVYGKHADHFKSHMPHYPTSVQLCSPQAVHRSCSHDQNWGKTSSFAKVEVIFAFESSSIDQIDAQMLEWEVNCRSFHLLYEMQWNSPLNIEDSNHCLKFCRLNFQMHFLDQTFHPWGLLQLYGK